jgi:MDMPI C-terminal domain
LPYAYAQAGRTLTGPVAFQLRAPSGAAWDFLPEAEPATTIRGDGAELCQVAARRMAPEDTALTGDGPDADAVLELVRTYA